MRGLLLFLLSLLLHPCIYLSHPWPGKRQLQRNSRDILIIGCCFVLWGAIVIVVYGSSMQQLQQVGCQAHRVLLDVCARVVCQRAAA